MYLHSFYVVTRLYSWLVVYSYYHQLRREMDDYVFEMALLEKKEKKKQSDTLIEKTETTKLDMSSVE